MKKNFKYFSITRQTTDEDLKKQFRELSKQLHPDRETGSEEAFTEMMKEYEAVLKSRSGKTIEGIRDRIRDELNDFYTRIAPELTQYKPEFLQLYDDLFLLAMKAIERGATNLANRFNVPRTATFLAKKALRNAVKREGRKYRDKLENL